eukprot:6199922-Pleurochrysis_carterae.AAC.5
MPLSKAAWTAEVAGLAPLETDGHVSAKACAMHVSSGTLPRAARPLDLHAPSSCTLPRATLCGALLVCAHCKLALQGPSGRLCLRLCVCEAQIPARYSKCAACCRASGLVSSSSTCARA